MKEKIMPDGWHDYNPHKARCECGSSNVEFLWQNGEVRGFHCKSCGTTELDKG